MFRLLLAVTAAILFLSVVSTRPLPGQQESRTWTSRDGQNRVEAAFSEYDPDSKTVSLVVSGGETIQVELDRLSQADRRHVIRVARTRPDPTVEDNADRFDTVRDGKTKSEKKTGRRSDRYNHSSRPMYGIQWTDGIENALKSAAGSESAHDDRPVMWMRVLGDLSGFM